MKDSDIMKGRRTSDKSGKISKCPEMNYLPVGHMSCNDCISGSIRLTENYNLSMDSSSKMMSIGYIPENVRQIILELLGKNNF